MRTLVACLYLLLGTWDLFFSLIAFSHGVPEGNPLLAYLLAHNLFVVAKASITVFISLIIVYTYDRSKAAAYVSWISVVIMLWIDVVHVLSLHYLV